MAISHLKVLWCKKQLEILAQGLNNPSSNSAGMFDEIIERSTISLWSQLLILTHRHSLHTFYKLHGLKGTLVRNIAGGVFFGVVYYQNGTKLWNSDGIVELPTLDYK